MQKNCKDCRFYEERYCSMRKRVANGASLACSLFSAFSTRDTKDFKYCKDCRFFSGGQCSETKRSGVNPIGIKCSRASICR